MDDIHPHLRTVQHTNREHPEGRADCWLSTCGRQRYALRIRLRKDVPSVENVLVFVMLNPSTADSWVVDPTARRCIERAKAMGFDTVLLVNLFAYRATQPEDLKAQGEYARDPHNLEFVLNTIKGIGKVYPQERRFKHAVVCAWGNHGGFLGAAYELADGIVNQKHPVHALDITKAGHPKHPLYIPMSKQPKRWVPQALAEQHTPH